MKNHMAILTPNGQNGVTRSVARVVLVGIV